MLTAGHADRAVARDPPGRGEPVGDYAATVPGVIDWLISTAHGTGAAQLPAGFGDEYFANRFDYAREDASLGSH